MTGVTSITLIHISRNTIVFILQIHGVVMFVAINTAKRRKIASAGMAIRTIIPFSLVFPTVNGEVHTIMVEGGWRPGRFGMAALAIRRELRSSMVGVRRLVVITGMAAKAGVRRVIIIAVVAGVTIIRYGRMSSSDRINTIVIKSRRYPSRFGMAALAIRRELRSSMVGARRLVVIIGVAACTSIRRVVIIPVVAGGAIAGNGSMRPVQHIIIIVDAKGGRRPARRRRMAALTVHREAQRLVVRVHTLGVVLGMATVTGIGGIVVVPVVAAHTIIRHYGVCTRQRVETIVVEGGWRPGRFRVAAFAIHRELPGLVVGVRRLVVILRMAACAGIRRVVVVPVVATCAVICNRSVRPIQSVIIVMVIKRSGVPARPGGMAGRTIRRQPQCVVVGVRCLVKISCVAGGAFGGGARIAAGVAVQAFRRSVPARQRESRHIVVEHRIRIARRMARQAGRIFINIPSNTGVSIVRLRVGVAVGATVHRVV